MSIATQIERLQGAKADIKTSIENKGVTVSPSATLDLYPSYIDQINTGVQPDSIVMTLSNLITVGNSATVSIAVTFGSTTFTLTDPTQASVVSSNPAVASVTVSGSTITVTGLTEGTATITASIGTATDSTTLNVVTNPYAAYSSLIQAGTMESAHPVGEELFEVPYTEGGTTYRMPMIIVDYRTITLGDGTTKNACILQPKYLNATTLAWSSSDDTSRNYSRNPSARNYLENTYRNFYDSLFLEALAPSVKITTSEYNSWSAVTTTVSGGMWIPSGYELGVTSTSYYQNPSNEGPQCKYYENIGTGSNAKRAKYCIDAQTTTDSWWSRSLYGGGTSFQWGVYAGGDFYGYNYNDSYRLCPLMALI